MEPSTVVEGPTDLRLEEKGACKDGYEVWNLWESHPQGQTGHSAHNKAVCGMRQEKRHWYSREKNRSGDGYRDI